jgi:hypothetical protein
MPEVARYTYTDAEGTPVYDTVRIEPGRNGRSKDFGIERIDGGSTRVSGQGCMDGVERMPYNLPLLLAGIQAGEPIYFVEGEKCAEVLISQGLIATTCAGGAQAQLDARFLAWFHGAQEVVVLADCDAPGRQAAARRSILLSALCKTKIVDISRDRSDGYDVADWFGEGHKTEELERLVSGVPFYDPPTPQRDMGGVREVSTQPPGVEPAKIYTLGALLHEAVKRTEDAVENGPKIQRTPWKALDMALGGRTIAGGFSPGEVCLWAASPGIGKSAAVWMLADHAAAKHGTTILASIEMGEIDAAQRLIALYSGIGLPKMRSGQLSADEWRKLAYVEEHLGTRRLAIIGRDGRNIEALKKSVEATAQAGGLATIIVDHVGMIEQGISSSNYGTRNDSLEAVYRTFGDWAHAYNVVVHVVSHLNRRGYGRKPTLADLRDGGNGDGHANYVIFPYRKSPDGSDEARSKGEFDIAKCRDGWTGNLPMKYTGDRYMWTSTEDQETRPWFESEKS